MLTTWSIANGYPCGHHVAAEYVTTTYYDAERVTADTYRCDSCGTLFAVLIPDD